MIRIALINKFMYTNTHMISFSELIFDKPLKKLITRPVINRCSNSYFHVIMLDSALQHTKITPKTSYF